MIQGATLDAVFCAMEDCSSKVRDAQILAYVGASRVRLLSKIYILQQFSPTLFTQGTPKGPDLLLRKLEGTLSPAQALDAWEAENADEKCRDILKKEFLCVSCYRGGAKKHMHLPSAFGCTEAADAIKILYREGVWRRCLTCTLSVIFRVGLHLSAEIISFL